MYDTSDLSCSNDGSTSVNIAYHPGTVPEGSTYDKYVMEVDPSDEGELDYIITNLLPGNVSPAFSVRISTRWRLSLTRFKFASVHA